MDNQERDKKERNKKLAIFGGIGVMALVFGIAIASMTAPKNSDAKQQVVSSEQAAKDLKKKERTAKELVEYVGAAEVKDGKVIGEGGKELSKEEVKELAKLAASKDDSVVDQETRKKLESMVEASYGKEEGQKILEAYKSDAELQKKVDENKPVAKSAEQTGTDVASSIVKKEVEEQQKPSNPAPNKPAEKPKDGVEYKTETETYSIPFKTLDNYASSGGESRVYQGGKEGSGTKTYNVKYVNGVKKSSELVSDVETIAPVNQIIERYIKTADAKYEEREVDDLDKPIYDYYTRDRWFINFTRGDYYYDQNHKSYDELSAEEKSIYFKTEYFYVSAADTAAKFDSLGSQFIEDTSNTTDYSQFWWPTNWGDMDKDIVYTDEILGYEQKIENVKVSDEVWEWVH